MAQALVVALAVVQALAVEPVWAAVQAVAAVAVAFAAVAFAVRAAGLAQVPGAEKVRAVGAG